MFNLVPWKTRRPGGEGDFTPIGRSRDLARPESDALWDRFWDGAWPWSASSLAHWGWSMDVDDRDNEIVIRAEAPGFEPNEFNLQMRGNQLVIEAEHKEESKGPQGAGCRYGKFQRVVTLPQGVDAEKINARYRSGVLEVHAPKAEEAKGRRIRVNAG
jgi:HSP20 family protein